MTVHNNLFAEENKYSPLADRMRPSSLEQYIGQSHLLDEGKPLRLALEQNQCHSMIFWGPPGTGKTTLARMFADNYEADCLSISAVLSGVKEIRAAIEQAKMSVANNKQAILFVDEVHRFNKSQQDAFLPYVEDGTLTFIGATTENPSFELNNALLSRARVYVLKQLTQEELIKVLQQALRIDEAFKDVKISEENLTLLARAADGDARRALGFLEMALDLATELDGIKTIKNIEDVISNGVRRFDKGGEAFYDQISALHKSIRGSSPDAALYWLCRMLDGGADPSYLARRLVRIASEDIGNADIRALTIACDAAQSYERLGSPEGELTLAQCAIYLAIAPKSNAVYNAYNKIRAEIKATGTLAVPLHLRNAPTDLMKELGYKKEYRYAHDEPYGYAAAEQYLPDELKETRYYLPVDRGLEKKIADKMAFLQSLDHKAKPS